jgi:hypothetical protein
MPGSHAHSSFWRVPFIACSSGRLARRWRTPTWIGAAVLAYWVNLMLRIWRWQIILSSVAPVRYSIVARALLVGYGLNTIIPARLRELFRAEFAKRIFGVSRVWTLTSIEIERVFDGLTVVF